MIFKDIQDKFEYNGIRELGQFSDLEIRLINIDNNIGKKISEILNNEVVNNYDLVGNYLNINFKDDYLRKLFLGLNMENKKIDKSIIIQFFSPNPGQNIHLGVLRNILLGLFVSNLYKNQYSNIKIETMLCDSGEVFETLLSIYDGKGSLSLGKGFYENPLLEYENKAKSIVNTGDLNIEKISESKLRKKLTDFSLSFFENQLSKLGLSFDEVNLQSSFSYIDKKLLSILENNFKFYKSGISMGLFVDGQENPQMIINQNGNPTYLLKELNGIVNKYNEGDRNFLFILGTDQSHHFKIVKKILSVIYPEINIDTYFHNMIILKDGKDKKSAKNYTLDKLIGLIELNKNFLKYFSQENILLLHLMSDIFIAKKDKEVVFNGEYGNKDLAERIIKNYIFLKEFNNFHNNGGINGVKSGLYLYKGILSSIDKKETSFVFNSLSLDYSNIKFQNKEELEKFINIFKYGLEIIGIKPIM